LTKAIFLVILLPFFSEAFAAYDGEYSINNLPVTITERGKYRIYGNGRATGNTITVNASATGSEIVLENVTIDVSDSLSGAAFKIDADARIYLSLRGKNTLKSGDKCAGLNVFGAVEIADGGIGSLNATGGKHGAGIGGSELGDNGTIVIHSGEIIATGGKDGAGIGGGIGAEGGGFGSGSGGMITINGGSITAIGGNSGAGIGGGGFGDGGTVVAVKGDDCNRSDIGPGNNNNDGSVIITGGSVKSSVQPQPMNANTMTVYRTEISFNPVSDSKRFFTEAIFHNNNNRYVYGTAGVVTDDNDKTYFWLPVGDYAPDSIILTTNNANTYKNLDAVSVRNNNAAILMAGNGAVRVTGMSFINPSVILAVDSSTTLTVDIAPETATHKNVKWRSSDTSIVTVTPSDSLNCTIIAKALGEVFITATAEDGGKNDTCRVKVINHYTVNFRLSDTIQGFDITATNNNRFIASGEDILHGSKLVIKVNNAAAADSSYRYAWIGDGIPEGAATDRDSLVIDNVAGVVDVTCTATGPYYPISFALSENSSEELTVSATYNNNTITSDTSVLSGSKFVIKVNIAANFLYNYEWTGTGIPEGVATDRDSLVIDTFSAPVDVACTVTDRYCPVRFTLADASPGFGISATYDGSPITSGSTVVPCSDLILTVTGIKEKQYKYTWSGTGVPDAPVHTDIPTLIISNLTDPVDVVCTITGPYYPVSFTLDGAPSGWGISGATIAYNGSPIASGDAVLHGDSLILTVTGGEGKQYTYTWSGIIDHPFTPFVSNNPALSIYFLTGPVDVTCTVTEGVTAIDPLALSALPKARIADGVLHVEGLTPGAAWQVCTVTGIPVGRGLSDGSTTSIRLPGKGVYIFVSGSQRVKIIEN
jgi:hypothetical protein